MRTIQTALLGCFAANALFAGQPAQSKNQSTQEHIYTNPHATTSEGNEPLFYLYRPHNTSWQIEGYGEVLFWKVSENVGEWAAQGEQTSGEPSGNIATRPHSRHPGYTLGVRADFDPRYWGVEVNYTDFNATDSQAITEPVSGDRLVGIGLTFTGDAPLSYFNKSTVNYDQLNILFKRQFLPAETLLVNFYAGPSFLWVKEKTHVTYQGGIWKQLNTNRWNFNGRGLRIGVDSDWLLDWGFSAMANLSFGGYYGEYQYYAIDSLESGTAPRADFNVEQKQMAYDIQLAIGPAWGWKWDCCAVKVYGVYNTTLINGVLKLYQWTDAAARNDGKFLNPVNGLLGLEGFRVGASFTF